MKKWPAVVLDVELFNGYKYRRLKVLPLRRAVDGNAEDDLAA